MNEEFTICPMCKEWTAPDEDGWGCCCQITDPDWMASEADRLVDEYKDRGNE
jgi:hypothetical protein